MAPDNHSRSSSISPDDVNAQFRGALEGSLFPRSSLGGYSSGSKSRAETFRALATAKSFNNVTFRTPRSMPDM
jgi:hypothetical protein